MVSAIQVGHWKCWIIRFNIGPAPNCRQSNERGVTINCINYGYILDLFTDYLPNGVIGCGTITDRLNLADVLTAAAFVKRVEKGLDKMDELLATEGMIIDSEGGNTFFPRY